jgi:FdhD protein
MARMTQRRKIHRYLLDGSAAAAEYPVRFKEDVLAAEEPLEIRLGTLSFAVTMRTPGDDFDLVAGFLVSEGIIRDQSELVSLRFCAGEDEQGRQTFNVVEAQLGRDVPVPEAGRNIFTSSSCGICGTDSIEAVHKTLNFDLTADRKAVPVETLADLPRLLREAQDLFEQTGGVHAAGLLSIDQATAELLCLREDVGRQNAVDKVVVGLARRTASPDGHRPPGFRPGLLRTRPKGRPRGHSRTGRGERAFQPGCRPCRRDRPDPGGLQQGEQPQRLHGRGQGGTST